VSGEALILYYQNTLGPAHVARVRALDAEPGVRCLGVQIASAERTRAYELSSRDRSWCHTLVDGTYEDIPYRRLVAAVRAQLAAHRPTAVILDSTAESRHLLIGLLVHHAGIPVFVRWASTRDDYPRRAWRERLKGLLYRRWDGYLVTGRRARAYLSDFGVPENRIHVCGNPVDPGPIESELARLATRRREPRFLYVGRFIPHKNLERLIRAYATYRARGGTWSLKLVGFGPTEDRVRQEARDLDGVSFEGFLQLPRLVEEYASASGLVLPSSSENWGLVVNEAMHTALPVLVSTRCGCYPELVEGRGTGLSFDPFDTVAMAGAMGRFERLSAQDREQMGVRCRQVIKGNDLSAWASVVSRAVLGRLGCRRGPGAPGTAVEEAAPDVAEEVGQRC